MVEKQNNVKGYKPGQVCELIGESYETLRYWREYLYPKPPQIHFSLNDIFIYHFIKSFIKGKRVDVNELEKVEWRKILQRCSSLSAEEKKSCIAVFDFQSRKFSFITSINQIDLSDDRYTFVYMKTIFNRFNLSLRKFGNARSNIVPIETGLFIEAS